MFRFVMFVVIGLCLTQVANAADLLSYEETGWKYKQVPWGDSLTETFYATTFDDSGWSTGQAGFGNMSEPMDGCAAVFTIHTQWSVNTDMLLRRYFLATTMHPVKIYLAIDNDADVYVNGIQIFTATHESWPFPDDFMIDVPIEILSPTGANLLAVRAHDRGGFSFVDLRATGEYPPVAVEGSTWGAIKALYR